MNADTKPPLHVVLIQDVREVREGLAALISGTTGYECVAAYGMMGTALARIKRDRPDVILTDLGLPGMSGVEELNGCGRCFQILLLSRWTIFDNDDRIFSAVLNGANGYLLKNTLPARLLRALRKRSQAARRCLRSSRAHGAAVP